MRRQLPAAALLALIVQGDPRPTAAASVPSVHVRASAAFAACLSPALEAFTHATGVPVELTTADPDPPQDADLVVGDDGEMLRLLEGGTADVSSAVDLGQLPWVFVVPQGSPAGAVSTFATTPVAVMAGPAGREARASLALPPGRFDVTDDPAALRAARYSLVPRSLAGRGERRGAAVTPLVAGAAVISGSPRAASARRLLAFLAGENARRALGGCFDPMPSAPSAPSARAAAEAHLLAAAGFPASVVDWWLPRCSLDTNRYSDPEEVLGPPDAVNLGGGAENYLGFMSLGQGGYVTVDAGVTVVDGPGPDVRIFQTTANEAVTLYAAQQPTGPFRLVGLRAACGIRSPGVLSNHCDFDFAAAGITSARYLKVEDGEIFPCLARGTATEGADIDAVEILSAQP